MLTRRILVAIELCALSAFVAAFALWPRADAASAAGVIDVVAGRSHTCLLRDTGDLKCWGQNDFGQLGDGTTTQRALPQDVLIGSSDAIAAGQSHTCAITTAGGVKCWGAKGAGQVGPSSTDLCIGGVTDVCNVTPTDVPGLSGGVVALGAGQEHTCAITSSGGVKCWGDNTYGQLGDGTTTSRTAPSDVAGLTSGVSAISVGSQHTCATTTSGAVKCWGWNLHGQLGTETAGSCAGIPCSTTPVDVPGLGGVLAVGAGSEHTCAVTSSGGVKCWGGNGVGQLGNGNPSSGRREPVDVSGLSAGVLTLRAGLDHTCAITSTGDVKCWGSNEFGQLGDGTSTNRSAPVNVARLPGEATVIALGGWHTCAVTTDGISCWGNNFDGQLGDGATTGIEPNSSPGSVVGLEPKSAPIPPPTLLGDASCDGRVDSIDATLILQLDAGLITSLLCPQHGDVNGDGAVNALDAVLILQLDAGLLAALPS